MPLVPPDLRTAFLRDIASTWLPGKTFRLVYRGLRDGLTPAAFHAHCDGKGPTFVLVRSVTSAEGYTFGGYSGVDWEGNERKHCNDAFLVSLIGPFNDGSVVFFPVTEGRHAVRCDPGCGPSFMSGFTLGSIWGGTSDFKFVHCDLRRVGGAYPDLLGRKSCTLTGTRSAPLWDAEVFAVV